MGLLEKLIEDPKVLYIYEVGLQIFGLFKNVDNREFIVICENDYCPQDFSNVATFKLEAFDENNHFLGVEIKNWFPIVMNGSMLGWECACLPKKFIHKEYVKLLLQTNPLQLRKSYEHENQLCRNRYKELLKQGAIISAQQELFNLFKLVKFSNQIIENHKIVNFKCLAEDYRNIVTASEYDLNKFDDYLNDELIIFKKYTDDLLRRDKIKKIIQNG